MKDDEENDYALFRQHVADVRPLASKRVTHKRPKPKARAIKREEDDKEVMSSLMESLHDLADIELGDELFYARSDLPGNIIKKLKQGKFSIQDQLDLHQMDRHAAQQSILMFIEEMGRKNKRCIRIIHGKGLGSGHKGPVLKQVTNKVLQKHPNVLAFCSAKAVHGGTGAVYVLLGKNR